MNNHLFQLLGVETWQQQSNFQFFDLWYFGWSERFCPNKWVVILTSVHRSTEVPTRSSSGTSRCQLSLNALVMADLLGWNNWPNHPLEKENNKMQVSSYVEYTALELKTILNYKSPTRFRFQLLRKHDWSVPKNMVFQALLLLLLLGWAQFIKNVLQRSLPFAVMRYGGGVLNFQKLNFSRNWSISRLFSIPKVLKIIFKKQVSLS